MCVFIIYVCIYIYRERERQRSTHMLYPLPSTAQPCSQFASQDVRPSRSAMRPFSYLGYFRTQDSRVSISGEENSKCCSRPLGATY